MKRKSSNRLQIWLRGAAVTLLAGLVVFLAGRYGWRGDFSRGRINSLAPRTTEILDGLDGPLSVTLYLPDREPERGRVAALLDACAARHGALTWRIVDPGRHPRAALADGVSEPGTVVLRYGERRHDYRVDHAPDGTYRLDEAELAGALLDVSLTRSAVIRVMQGPGFRAWRDRQGFSGLERILSLNRYTVLPWEPLRSATAAVPAGTDLLIVPGPHLTLPAPALAGIADFLAAGNPVLLLLDPAAEMGDSSLAAGLAPLLAARHIELDAGFVVDMGEVNRNLGKSFEMPVVAAFGVHEVCEAWHRRSDLVCLPLVRRLGYDGEADVPPLPLAMSSERSYCELGELTGAVRFDGDTDIPGPAIMAALSPGDGAGGGPLLVIGDSNFATNEHIDWEGNANFALDSVSWLVADGRREAPTHWAGRHELLDISRAGRRNFLLFSLLLLPLITFLWPLGLWLSRRGSRQRGNA